LDRQKYVLSDSFYSLLANDDSKSVLIVDDLTSPRRVFLVKYLLGAVGENTRLILRNELTGYDYEQQVIYPTQKAELDQLQSLFESFVYGSLQGRLSHVDIENSGDQKLTVKVIMSNELVSAIIDLYQFAW